MLMFLCNFLLVLIVKVCPHGHGEGGDQPKMETCGQGRGRRSKYAQMAPYKNATAKVKCETLYR